MRVRRRMFTFPIINNNNNKKKPRVCNGLSDNFVVPFGYEKKQEDALGGIILFVNLFSLYFFFCYLSFLLPVPAIYFCNMPISSTYYWLSSRPSCSFLHCVGGTRGWIFFLLCFHFVSVSLWVCDSPAQFSVSSWVFYCDYLFYMSFLKKRTKNTPPARKIDLSLT